MAKYLAFADEASPHHDYYEPQFEGLLVYNLLQDAIGTEIVFGTGIEEDHKYSHQHYDDIRNADDPAKQSHLVSIKSLLRLYLGDVFRREPSTFLNARRILPSKYEYFFEAKYEGEPLYASDRAADFIEEKVTKRVRADNIGWAISSTRELLSFAPKYFSSGIMKHLSRWNDDLVYRENRKESYLFTNNISPVTDALVDDHVAKLRDIIETWKDTAHFPPDTPPKIIEDKGLIESTTGSGYTLPPGDYGDIDPTKRHSLVKHLSASDIFSILPLDEEIYIFSQGRSGRYILCGDYDDIRSYIRVKEVTSRKYPERDVKKTWYETMEEARDSGQVYFFDYKFCRWTGLSEGRDRIEDLTNYGHASLDFYGKDGAERSNDPS